MAKEIKFQSFDFEEVEQADLTSLSDLIIGTQQGELLIGTSSSEPILGLEGDDLIVGKDGNDTLSGGAGNDSLQTGRGNNLLLGNDGDDILIVSNNRSEDSGNNVLNGGAGSDLLLGNDGNDLLTGVAGNDAILGFGGTDNISGGAGIDLINGGQGNDRIQGQDGNDSLEGGDDNDLISGGDGSDIISGLEGLDTLNGGMGADFFNLIPNTGRDIITDFEVGQDKLVLTPTPRFGSKLTFEQLSITESNNNTVIAIAETEEILAILNGVSPSDLSQDDFTESVDDTSQAEVMEDYMEELLLYTSPEATTNRAEDIPSNNDRNDNHPKDLSEVGLVTSQGVEVVNADEARRLFDVDGSGITVGVLSDSFDRDQLIGITADDDIATGDLPGANNPNGFDTPVTILDDSADNSSFVSQFGSSLIDEGRAMTQIITDVAPGANILFRTAFNGADDFATGIDELVAAGADIIVDDIGYFSEPFFQDGVIAQAANNAVEQGVAYFSSAGNSARQSYESEFRLTTDNSLEVASLESYGFHDFAPGGEVDLFQNFTLAPGEGINLSFQWDEPFASAGGRGARSDLDLFVLDTDNNVVAVGAESNIGTDALESISFSNLTETDAEYKLLIGQDTLTGGEAPNQIKYLDITGSLVDAEYFTNSPTVFGHPNAENVSAVGASFYQTPRQLEAFSSVGVVPILFDEQGNRLPEPELRQSPDIVAPDNVNTTFFFDGFDPEGDGFPNFPGTSAAAPHAAGVAALLLDAVPEATPEQIYGALEQTAIDLDNPYTNGFDRGFDTATGFGLIQADLALDSLLG